jgi:hypothetical protein
MFIDKDSLIINGISMGQYISEAIYGFYDTWSNDTGYTLSSKFTGTFKGTFPKITVKFVKLKQDEIIMLTKSIFRTTTQTVVYDDIDGTRKTIKTHKGDLELNFIGINNSKGFTYEFVGNEAL